MDITVLQQRLAEQRHLLPSQHELLNRLLFQLAFNDFQNIGLVGGEGSGKSTLALALAELFSEQANVALLNGAVSETEIESQLLQHWFGRQRPEPTLAQLMAEPAAGALPLLLIVDNFNQLATSARQKLLQLDCLGFFLLSEPSVDMALNLSINIPTLQDASQVLRDKQLEPLAVAERFAASHGNMHLLHSAVIQPEERKSAGAAYWLLPAAIVLLVMAAAIYWLLPVSNNVVKPKITDTPELVGQRSSDTASDLPSALNTAQADNATGENSVEPATGPALSDSTNLKNSPEPEIISAESAEKSPEPVNNSAVSAVEPPREAESTATEPPAVMPQEIRSAPQENAEPAATTKAPDSTEPVTVAAEALYQEPLLLSLPPEIKVLQLAVLTSDAAVARFVRSFPDTGIMVYQRSWQGQLQWVILAKQYYPDTSSARQARALLPERLRETGPFIKPVVQVQQEIKALARLRADALEQE